MYERQKQYCFHSGLAQLFENFISEKRTCGFHYNSDSRQIRCLDRFLVEKGWHSDEFPRVLIEEWLSKRPYEKKSTHDRRKGILRQFASFLTQKGKPVTISPCRARNTDETIFTPKIFTLKEIGRMFTAVDSFEYNSRSPLRYIIMPEIFRLLYCCGLRSGEARCLKVEDVNLDQGVLTIRNGKSGIDRFVPMNESMRNRILRYAEKADRRNPDEYFFPAPDSGVYNPHAIYEVFRKILWMSGISHGGRGIGPRPYDLRHTFAVHRLIEWYREGANLNAKLPVLATYMGHKKLSGTQHYLHLTANLNLCITARFEEKMGHIIPRRSEP